MILLLLGKIKEKVFGYSQYDKVENTRMRKFEYLEILRLENRYKYFFRMKVSSRLAIKNLTIVGAGQMGAGIAQVGAVTGHQVVLNDISEKTLARAQSGIEKSLKRMTKKMSAEDADAFMANTLRYMIYRISTFMLRRANSL